MAAIPTCFICESPTEAPVPSDDELAPASVAYAPSPEPDFEIPDSPSPSPMPFEGADGVFDVTEYGAVPDEATENSKAFLAAWDAACDHTGNSIFYIPEGVFLVGPVSFSGPCLNNQSPDIKIFGTLMAPGSLDAFPESNWIEFKNLANFRLTGGNGKPNLDGQGAVGAWKQSSCTKASRCRKLVTSLKFSGVSNGEISDITVIDSKAFHIGFHGSSNIVVQNITITAPGDSPNTDGIHVSHSTNISITSSKIGVGDDCVSIGPGSYNISISNIKCGPGHGISVGSLGKYKNEEDVYGISVRNCTINGTQNGIRIKTWPGAPISSAYDMTFRDITMINVSNPIILDQEYCPGHSCKLSEPSLVKLRDIYLKNIQGTYNTPSAVTLLCSSSVPCENIQLVGVNLTNMLPTSRPREGRLNVKGVTAMALLTSRRSLASLINRTLSSYSSSSSSLSSRSRFALALLDKPAQLLHHIPDPVKLPARFGSGYTPLNDPSPNWSNRPPKETILLDGCDYEHWLIVLEFPKDPKPSEEEMIDAYVKTLTAVVGSEEEAKKRIYSVCTTTYTGFGALISEELSHKICPVFCGCCRIHIWMFLTKTMEGICTRMARSSTDLNIGLTRGNKPGTGLAPGMIGAVNQCLLREENRCKDKPGAKIRDNQCSNLLRTMARIQLKVEGMPT
ncbi:hypothetical protein Tsubulata_011697 [Turnera subulata]|uniref:MORF/ORRM1/DAG-like MORF domain-containing protein n=1 Tax=Turnera subulata TaxID=218843 RepID=A0A9Q0JJJ0_9ROSI|nr:hypothetical protein Tsubulata_011697 [Turnera subulata]